MIRVPKAEACAPQHLDQRQRLLACREHLQAVAEKQLANGPGVLPVVVES